MACALRRIVRMRTSSAASGVPTHTWVVPYSRHRRRTPARPRVRERRLRSISPLAALLLLIAAGSEAFTVTLRGARVSGSFAALVLAMALLGPVPAAAIAIGAALFDGVISLPPAACRAREHRDLRDRLAVRRLDAPARRPRRLDGVRHGRRAGLHAHERAQLRLRWPRTCASQAFSACVRRS